jgi:hypothetical protein
MRYFAQFDVSNRPLPDSLFRYRDEDDLIFEEHWNSISRSWESTSYLTRLLIGGDCTIMEISKELASVLEQFDPREDMYV